MNNPISYALSYIRRSIPIELLNLTYLVNQQFRVTTAESLDDRIRQEVIYPIVLTDCNLIGGVETTLALDPSTREQVDLFTAIFRVPMTVTNHRRITAALSVGYGTATNNGFVSGAGAGFTSPSLNQNLVMGAASGVWASNTPIPLVSTARCVLIAENTVMVTDSIALPPVINLRCWLENEGDLTHIKPPSYIYFAQLVEHAVKANIWVKNKVYMDQGSQSGGSEIGAYKEIVEGYADSNQNYREFFDETWGQVTRFNDGESKNRKIRLAMGGRQ